MSTSGDWFVNELAKVESIFVSIHPIKLLLASTDQLLRHDRFFECVHDVPSGMPQCSRKDLWKVLDMKASIPDRWETLCTSCVGH